jgi:hypothetical protein
MVMLLSAGLARAGEVVELGAVCRSGNVRHNESTTTAAKDDPGGLTWISQDATYEASSSYVRDDGTAHRPLPSLLAGQGRRYRPGGGEDSFAFHTNRERDPHIIIDLAGVSTFQRLFIENRRGMGVSELSRASGLTVWVSDDKKSWRRIWTARRVAPSWMVKLKAPVAAKYVKIGLNDTNYLHLTTVKIYGLWGGIPPMRRLERADRIELGDGNVMLGTIDNKSYTVTAFYGKLEVPARNVVGIVASSDTPPRVSLTQTDGQVIVGTLADQTVHLTLPAGSTLSIPSADIRQLAYQISKDRPAVLSASQPTVLLHSGDRLIWTECRSELQLVGTWGAACIPLQHVQRIEPVSRDGRGYRVRFQGGGVLSGSLEPRKLRLKLKVVPELEIASKDIRQIALPTKPPEPPGARATILLHDGTRLLGRLEHETLELRTALGRAKVYVGNLKTLVRDPKRPAFVTITTWDGMRLRGQLAEAKLACRITPGGPRVSLKTVQVASVARSAPLLRPEAHKKAEKLIAQLAAESYKDREAATKALVRMGKGIVPLLRKHADSPDAEVRQRIEGILRRIDVPGTTPAPPLDVERKGETTILLE